MDCWHFYFNYQQESMNNRLTRWATYVFGCWLALIMLLWLYFMWGHMLQLTLPTSYRYTYNSVTLSKDSYAVWEDIYWVSDVTRNNPIKTQRQDTMSCNNELREKKYTTQYRPMVGTETPQLWTHTNNRLYSYKPDLEETKCRLCGTVVATTDYGYNKNYQYCTLWFGVNGHRANRE